MNTKFSDGRNKKLNVLLSGRLIKLGVASLVGLGTLSAILIFLTSSTAAQNVSLKSRRRETTLTASKDSADTGVGKGVHKTQAAISHPLQIVREFPKDHSLDANGLGAIVVNFNAPLKRHAQHPTLSPKVPGRWQKTNTSFVFRPSVAILPNTLETVTVQAGVTSKTRGKLAKSSSFEFATRAGSTLRVDQILAELNYLPFHFVASLPKERNPVIGLVDAAKYFWNPPGGTFNWDFKPPASLAANWSPGVQNEMFSGALVAFESDHNLPMSTAVTTQDWQVLLKASMDPAAYQNPHGYDYALVQEGSPETLTVYHNGQVVLDTPANTGISLTPTTLGTFYVYEKLPYQVMKGVNPDGVPYADPVQYVSYFDGGEAVHYIYRAEYGFPQSLGCVELPITAAPTAYNYLPYGTLVTIEL
jgi:lipoprotein-anchoring transpeptidase ErfK/SrfK